MCNLSTLPWEKTSESFVAPKRMLVRSIRSATGKKILSHNQTHSKCNKMKRKKKALRESRALPLQLSSWAKTAVLIKSRLSLPTLTCLASAECRKSSTKRVEKITNSMANLLRNSTFKAHGKKPASLPLQKQRKGMATNYV